MVFVGVLLCERRKQTDFVIRGGFVEVEMSRVWPEEKKQCVINRPQKTRAPHFQHRKGSPRGTCVCVCGVCILPKELGREFW